MKRLALIFALLLCTLPLSGCAILFEEPSALILPPASDQEEYVERTLINSFLNDGPSAGAGGNGRSGSDHRP